MGDAEQSVPIYERGWFKGTAAAIGLVAAIWALVGAPKVWDVGVDAFSTELPFSNTAIVLDASAAMDEGFGKGSRTKFEAAVEAIGEYVTPFRNEGLALRRAGGECDESGDLLVDFDDDHAEEVREAAAAQAPAGESNLANAILATIDEFSDSERFRGPPPTKRVVVFTGGGDQCLRDAPERIRNELDRTGIEAEFTLVALKVSGPEEERLKEFANALGERAEVRFVETEEELEEEVLQAQDEALVSSQPPAGEGSETTTTDEGENPSSTEATTTESPEETSPPEEESPTVPVEPAPTESTPPGESAP